MFASSTNRNKLAIQRNSLGQTITIPFCTGGLNTKDPLPSMPPQDAIILKNLIVENDKVTSRNGYNNVVGNYLFDYPVESLFEYSSQDLNDIIICSGSKIYLGLPNPTEIGSGFSSARWQGLMMNNNLLLFNGQDTPQKYNGSNLSNNVLTGSGLNSSNIVGATNFKNKLIAWENNRCGFWYGSSDAISGTLNYFDLSYITKKGGYVVACATWSYDSSGGTGLQARLVIFMSSGEAIVYEGTDPGSVDNWSIIGKFKVSPPVSQRAFLEYSGDILLVNKYDLITFSEVFSSGENPNTQSKLVGAIKEAVTNFGLNFGWEMINYPTQGLIIVNVPESSSQFTQYVINTRSGGCSQFTNINAHCFAMYNNNLYFGGAEKIYQCLNGESDDGQYIDLDIQTSFSNFGVNQEKTLNYIKPYMGIDNDINFSYSINYDFRESFLSQNQLTTSPNNLWDTFFWDEVFWSPESEIKSIQYGVSGEGNYISYRIKTSVINTNLDLYSLFYSYSINAQ